MSITRRSLFATAGPTAAPPVPKLQHRTLGRTGLKVTTVGFGCMMTSDVTVIEKAVDLGVNYFHTARVYQGGNSERMLGAALKGTRKKVLVGTKSLAQAPAAALEDLETSLKELGTDYLDIWYVHAWKPELDDPSEGLLEALSQAMKQGKTRFVGLTTHGNQADVLARAVKLGVIDAVVTSYNFAIDEGLNPAIERAHKAGIGIIAMKVMAGGVRNAPWYPTPDEVRARVGRPGAPLAALKWALKNENVACAIPSMVDQEQLDENLRAMSERFRDNDGRVLTARLEELRPVYCRMCGACDGKCTQRLPVADLLRFLMYAESYGDFAFARQQYLELPADVKAARCNDCRDCAVQCLNGVRVAERLTRAQELFS
ncbi:MAG TPA: aldo/keto reductase [Bryobacteraceae bacterium]|nr:aldo/keto reductase [Bryobacteraceae bacterium]